MTNPAREKSMEMLVKGIDPNDIALSIGVDVSYVLALSNDPTFRQTLSNQRADKVVEVYDKDDAYDTLETLAMAQLGDALADERDTGKLLKAVSVLNGAKRRSKGEGGIAPQGVVVELHLPAFVQKYNSVTSEKDIQGQVVSVDGRPLLTKDTKSILEDAAALSPTVARIIADANSTTIEDL